MKILVINIKYLGDLIVSSPSIRSLRKTYPDSEIVLLLRKGFEPVFSNNPYINRIITFNPELKGNSSIKKIIDGLKFIIELRKERFDTVIVLHPGDRTAFWAWFTGAKKRIAPLKQSFSFLFNNKISVEENSMSYLEYYNKIISGADVKIDSDRTEIFVSENDKKWTDEFLNNNNISADNILIGIHPGASEPSKIWNTENFVQLIKKLLAIHEVRIILFEGPQDKIVCNEMNNKLEGEKNVYFVIADILKVAALIKKCKLFISNDTGTRHLAVAVQTPVLALIPEDYEKCWNFYSEINNHFTIFGKRNFSQSDLSVKPFLDGINVETVYERVGKLLKLW
ncbi:MAG: glycosyltransferase family 9 protein [Ignavibacteria bacterium]|nr:glycosyltransferase family 9 protein [Ignavibacteria bacterium]